MIKKQKICIRALDTLFFRDGRPFSMGSENWANGVFPPQPSVFYGALRSAYLGEHIESFAKICTDDDPTACLKINCIALYVNNRPCFPLPLDCVVQKDDKQAEDAEKLSLGKVDFVSNTPLHYCLAYKNPEVMVNNAPDAYVYNDTLSEYLNLEIHTIPFLNLSNYILQEPKIGIERDDFSHSVGTDGQLYRVDMKRLASHINYDDAVTEFFVEFEGISLPENGIVKLGGEGKAASYRKLDMDEIPAPDIHNNRFKLYFATPAIFDHGWLPGEMDAQSFIWNYNGLQLKLLTATVGKYINLGGFDMKERKTKPMRRGGSPGSVYYFEILDGTSKDAIDAFHGHLVSDYEIDRFQGFGLTFVGGINE